MACKVKAVLIGAGSVSFGRGTLVDLMTSEQMRDVDLTVAMVDVDEKALRRMTKLGRMLKEHYGSPAKLTSTTDRRKALKGADFVITAISLQRYQLWEQDFRVPVALGFRQVDGENGGPGAAFHSLRSIHLTIPICRDMEELCPDALLLNFTNPESRVCLAVSQLTNIRSAGLCHGPWGTLQTVARMLGRPEDEIKMTVGGINHFHWVLGLEDAKTGKGLMPAFNKVMRTCEDVEPLTRAWYELTGYFPFPAALHTGEYVQWAWELVPPFWNKGPDGRRIPAHAARPDDLGPANPPSDEGWDYFAGLEALAQETDEVVKTGKMTEEVARPSNEVAVPIIEDVTFDLGRRELSVNIPNYGAIPNLPDHSVVEIPFTCDAAGLHGEHVGPLPEPIAAICRTQMTIQDLLVAAYRERSRKLLLQALMLDPVVDSLAKAREMMDTLLDVEQDFLPKLK